MDTFLYITIVMLTLIAVFLFFSRNKILREKKLAERKLVSTLNDLENVYSEINTTQEELNMKYREIKASEDKIKKLAYEDSLTGLPNKAAFNEMLVQTLETLRKEEAVGIMYIDLDDFKQLDDMWGHANCDELILDVSHRLRQNLDENDYIARLGGDEFIVLSQNIIDVEKFGEKVRRIGNAFRFPFVTSFGQLVITISIGATVAPRDGTKAENLIKNAAMALFEAKHLGKNTYCYYSEELAVRELGNIELQSDLTNAIKNDSFVLKYTPMLDLKDKKFDVVRMKLLWDRGDGGLWQSNKFVSLAEATGQIFSLAENSLSKICEEMKIFPSKKVIIPLTKRLFLNYEFRKKLYEKIEETNTEVSRFIIEVDEGTLTSEFTDSSFVMEEMIEKGFTLRVGRFGRGGMSMEVLRDLPASQVSIPIDRILENHEEGESLEYISLISSVVNKLGKELSFTDISDPVEEDMVIKSGVKLVEGELYGPLLAADEVENFNVDSALYPSLM